jgi:microsomal dipeptidase-like Zn-dependent dipeptidase
VLRIVTALGLALAALAAAPAAHAQDRYALAGGCYGLKSLATGSFAAEITGGGYRADASQAGADRFHLQATDLGRYLLFGKQGDFLANGAPVPVDNVVDLEIPGQNPAERIQAEDAPSGSGDWNVSVADGAYLLSLAQPERVLAVTQDGTLVLDDVGSAGERARFAFEPLDGCAPWPEADTNVAGEPTRGATSFGEVRGFADAHMHMMAFEFLGGRVHCGRPWHRFGVAAALQDCPDHGPNGVGAIGENTLSYGNPVGTHDTRGWPVLKDWPHHDSLTHEQTYYKWLERSWRAGQRLMVNLLVDNEVLCTLYPLKQNSCNEMDGVRLQAKRLRELQDYVDAQSGGPGKGWFRIVETPAQARRVINQGKLAVVMGIEVSKLFDCGVQDGQPECTADQVDARLKEVYDLGVRSMEIVNKFDNGFAGVAGDTGTTGIVVNNGNRIETGRYWQMGPCADPHNHDKAQPTAPGGVPDRDALAGNLLSALMPPGATPIYGPAPHCNQMGLSDLGVHLVERMIQRKMIIDPDHLSVLARRRVLDVAEKHGYSGVISSHSWSSPDAIPRILRLGGVVTPMAGTTTEFLQQYEETKAVRDPRFYWGIGWGADMNGFAHQGAPRENGDVTYPFKSFDGRQTIGKQVSGQRVYDINVDGMAHYGLFPDWVEDLRHIGGQQIVDDLGRGAEAYLQMWERARGVPPTRCQPAKGRVTRRGLTRVRLGSSADALLRRAGQPRTRGRVWTWCAPDGRISALLTRQGRVTTAVSTAPRHTVAGAGRGDRLTRRAKARTKPLGRGLRVRKLGGGRRAVLRVRGGKVRWVAATTLRKRAAILREARRAGLR